MLAATQIRHGMIIQLDGTLYRVMQVNHLTPGNKRGIIQTQLRNLTSGNQEERRFSSDTKIERAHLDAQVVEFLYADGAHLCFMNTTTYEQITIDSALVGDAVQFLLPNTRLTVELFQGAPVNIVLPQTVVLTIAEAEPTVKRATASASFKQAKVETGLAVKVPSFIQIGDKIVIDTTTGAYVERA